MNLERSALLDRHPGDRGFTLIELMVTISIMAILMAMAVPSFTRLVASNRLSSQTNELMAALNLARIEAIRRGISVAIRSTSAGTDFQNGWKVFPDSDSNGVLAAESDVLRINQAGSGTTTVTRVKVSGSAYAVSDETDKAYIVFSSRGAKSTAGSAYFKVCDSGNTAIPGRIVRVLSAGTISLISTNESCT